MKAIYKQHHGFEHLNDILNPQSAQISNSLFIPPIHQNQKSYKYNQASLPLPLNQIETMRSPSLNSNNNPDHYFKNNLKNQGGSMNSQAKNTMQIDDTSTKKYPNNKYYKFNSEDASGRKFLKQKLNLYSDEDKEQTESQNDNKYDIQKLQLRQRQQHNKIRSNRQGRSGQYSVNINNREVDHSKQQTKNMLSFQQSSKGRSNMQSQRNPNYSQQQQKLNFYKKPTRMHNSQAITPYHNSTAINTIPKFVNLRQKQKILTNMSTIEPKHNSKSQYKYTCSFQQKDLNNIKEKKQNHKQKLKGKTKSKSRVKKNKKTISQSQYEEKFNEDQSLDGNDLKHYKKLCLQMRKKNQNLQKQLQNCREQNKKQLTQLQNKVNYLADKYVQRKEQKQNIDCNNKTQKIMQSLKTIKAKLNKKQSGSIKEEKKFYQFFVESLGVLRPQNAESSKFTALQIQIIWKHMLQFLITHDYKIEQSGISITNLKTKTLR